MGLGQSIFGNPVLSMFVNWGLHVALKFTVAEQQYFIGQGKHLITNKDDFCEYQMTLS